MAACYVGVDVGTGSARAGVFDGTGRMLGQASRAIRLWRPEPDFAEQSSDDIWQACCVAVKGALAEAGINPGQVKGVGFDATCSLVALDDGGRPVTVSPSGKDEQNVVVWMDHRAIAEAARINAGGHKVLDYVGGTISPEMETPKLVWLKQHLPETWRRAARFFDLPDFLTWRATGADVRSLCSIVCKWTYLGHEDRWDEAYFRAIGLGDLADEGFARIGQTVRPLGEAMGQGLSAAAAGELGLVAGTAVGVSIIDAHAGGLGMLGAPLGGTQPTTADMERRLALIGGTSSCHMAVSRQAVFVPGVWGPYYSAMVPSLWLQEGGQSATGALIDHVIFSHAGAAGLKVEAERSGRTVYALLNERLDRLAKDVDFPAALTRELHVLPYFHGNRSPRADPTLKGVVSGLRLNDSLDDLARLYLAAVQAVAHGTRHIIDTMNAKGYAIDTVFACGGGTKNPVFLREHADITGCRLVLPKEPEAVLLGSAILGAVAAGAFESVLAAMAAMNGAGEVIEPAGGKVAAFHAAKHRVFHRMYDDFMAWRGMMRG
ncbi:FGGY-family carbohydrate kinase [Shumkonia mesophila]|uniref:FGGY-family carbohydrate kinase n=1 Tax=Shumkonia mesophila TaxID=2838854 RepID=UPI0029342395|nr:FGGY-family carbohydrate kinase [Shumkonia mesophila]